MADDDYDAAIATLEERSRYHAEALKLLEQEKLDRRELEPVTWQLRSLVLAAISLLGALILYVLTRTKL